MSDIFSNFNLFNNTNNPYSNNSSSAIPLDNPQETVVYFQQQFSNILDSLLFDVSNSGDSNDDLFSDTSTDSLDSITNFYPEQIALLKQDYNVASGNIDELNSYSALISKEAKYIYNGQISQGIIQSVVIENGAYFLKIDGKNVAIKDISEISATT